MFNRKQAQTKTQTQPQQSTTDGRKAAPSSFTNPPRFLAYALPRIDGDAASYRQSHDGFELHDEPMGAGEAFQNFDGVVVFAGAFEEVVPTPSGSVAQSVNTVDLDQRERQFFTAVKQGYPFIFLLPFLPAPAALFRGGATSDLFRRVASHMGLSWRSDQAPHPALESAIPECGSYLAQYGVGYAVLDLSHVDEGHRMVVCRAGEAVYGAILFDRVFFLPCARPQTHEQALEMASAAIAAVIAYRKRVSRELPAWVAGFAFNQEASLTAEAEGHRKQLESLKTKILVYQDFKAALCLQSDPLVEAVAKIMEHFFGLSLTIDDKKIEDATLRDAAGNILAVFEIKGINGNFDRSHVNQVDSHRERLDLPATIPGIAIINTLRAAGSLSEKGLRPHPDIIKKAVGDNVLLIRTLDLLRFADLAERRIKTKEDFKNILLGESGWLKVEGDNVTVEKK